MSDPEGDKSGRRKSDEKTAGIRYRKAGAIYTSRMVGSGSGEVIGKDVVNDSTMELEMDSADENSPSDDTARLIPSTSSRISVEATNNNAANKKIPKRNGEIDEKPMTDEENVWTISVQMFIPFLLAGFGMVAASLLLDVVQVNSEEFHARS